MRRIQNHKYTIEIPKDWSIESSEDADSVFDPRGKGAITISSYARQSGKEDAEQALLEFANGRGVVKLDSKNGQNYAESVYYDENGRYVLAIAISRENTLVLASYNCMAEDVNDAEIEAAKNTILSIVVF